MKNQTEKLHFVMTSMRRRRYRWLVMTTLLFILTCFLSCVMLYFGNTIHPVKDIVRSLTGVEIPGVSFAVNTIRLPRMLAGLFSGFAFGIAGYIFQTLLRNPLANPNVLGITSGSSAAAVICITVFHTSRTVISFASIFAGLVTVTAMFFLSKGKSFSIGRLIIIGIGIQAMLDALISYLILLSAEQDIPATLRWLNGSLNGSEMDELPPLVMTVIIFTLIAVLLGKRLTVFELGDEAASSLGVATNKTRALLMICSVFLIAMATSTTGPIAFVSFLAGPIANRLVGVNYSNILPAGLVGASLVLGADLLGQFAFEYRFPVGVITGLLGAPYLILLLIRMNRKGEFS